MEIAWGELRRKDKTGAPHERGRDVKRANSLGGAPQEGVRLDSSGQLPGGERDRRAGRARKEGSEGRKKGRKKGRKEGRKVFFISHIL